MRGTLEECCELISGFVDFLSESQTSDSGESGFAIKKTTGSRPYWVVKRQPDKWPPEIDIHGFKTKQMAEWFLSAMHGDSEAAKKWYRKNIEKNLKMTGIYRTPKEAWFDSVQTAHMMGWSPAFVGADPETGEPK